jgi:hypothetical protein
MAIQREAGPDHKALWMVAMLSTALVLLLAVTIFVLLREIARGDDPELSCLQFGSQPHPVFSTKPRETLHLLDESMSPGWPRPQEP